MTGDPRRGGGVRMTGGGAGETRASSPKGERRARTRRRKKMFFSGDCTRRDGDRVRPRKGGTLGQEGVCLGREARRDSAFRRPDPPRQPLRRRQLSLSRQPRAARSSGPLPSPPGGTRHLLVRTARRLLGTAHRFCHRRRWRTGRGGGHGGH
ncbi:PREDICTED: CGG triplet repeat-binding protein 1 isoform X2 [Chinchilla lanigera]|uniref:CGG triplet repeat-binding protein 1 isoform X2 n=1 Tax=Chinchilla lanigera TaxID=34839 RepID=UPI00069658AF|nr:PREDICTED: CGG triplet repeat-binding protein 1 isoform X2 [Chinchilla lanigera]